MMKGSEMPRAPRYLAAGCFHIRENMPGVVPWPWTPPWRPMDHSTHINGTPRKSRAQK